MNTQQLLILTVRAGDYSHFTDKEETEEAEH